MPKPPKAAARLLASLLAAAMAAGCSAGPGDGPVHSGDGPAWLCVPVKSSPPLSRPVLLGNDVIRNTGSVPAVLHSVRLVGAQHIKAIDGYVLPFRGTTIYGDGASLPNPSQRILGPGNPWNERRPLSRGATLPPQATSTTKWQLIVAVQPTSPAGGSYQHIEVDYTVNGSPYHFTVPVGYAERATCNGHHPKLGT